MNGSSDDMANAHLTNKEFPNQFKQIEKLHENDNSIVKIFLDALITKKIIQQLAGYTIFINRKHNRDS